MLIQEFDDFKGEYTHERFNEELEIYRMKTLEQFITTNDPILDALGWLKESTPYSRETRTELIKLFTNNFYLNLPYKENRYNWYENPKNLERTSQDTREKLRHYQIIKDDLTEIIGKLNMNMEDIKNAEKNDRDKFSDILSILYIELRNKGHKHYPDLIG